MLEQDNPFTAVLERINWEERDEIIRAEREAEAKRDKAREQALRRHALIAAGFPDRAIEAAIAPFDTIALQSARRFERQFPRGWSVVVFSGGTGTGKTTAATWLAYNTMATPHFVTAFAAASLGRWGDHWQAWYQAGAFVLDDLGTEDPKSGFVPLFDALLSHFHGHRRLLAITTNLAKPAFERRYSGQDGRVMSRMRHAAYWVDCGGDDLRIHANEHRTTKGNDS